MLKVCVILRVVHFDTVYNEAHKLPKTENDAFRTAAKSALVMHKEKRASKSETANLTNVAACFARRVRTECDDAGLQDDIVVRMDPHHQPRSILGTVSLTWCSRLIGGGACMHMCATASPRR